MTYEEAIKDLNPFEELKVLPMFPGYKEVTINGRTKLVPCVEDVTGKAYKYKLYKIPVVLD